MAGRTRSFKRGLPKLFAGLEACNPEMESDTGQGQASEIKESLDTLKGRTQEEEEASPDIRSQQSLEDAV
ncbi:hypothetical protein NDU88_002319 [Pleurodeles waltl]|uniref:Uncharacterized protein n=1 Tax=Pleurodeles waltl TaxID=8319 RepID=A0AAV7SF22_PLEWA|nr:hypothetical protein NDU88_002319 [Pleurodeles waltl]